MHSIPLWYQPLQIAQSASLRRVIRATVAVALELLRDRLLLPTRWHVAKLDLPHVDLLEDHDPHLVEGHPPALLVLDMAHIVAGVTRGPHVGNEGSQ